MTSQTLNRPGIVFSQRSIIRNNKNEEYTKYRARRDNRYGLIDFQMRETHFISYMRDVVAIFFNDVLVYREHD